MSNSVKFNKKEYLYVLFSIWSNNEYFYEKLLNCYLLFNFINKRNFKLSLIERIIIIHSFYHIQSIDDYIKSIIILFESTLLKKHENFTLTLLLLSLTILLKDLNQIFNLLFENLISIAIFCFIQLLLFNKKSKTEINVKRKTFHFLLFGIFKNFSIEKMNIYKNTLAICLFFSSTSYSQKFFKLYLRKHESVNSVHSHIFLYLGSFLPCYFLKKSDSLKILISLCIMDSFASIIPPLLYSNNNKTLLGLFVGQISSYIAEYLLQGTISPFYHLCIGMVEYYSGNNDNLTIPYFGVLYFIVADFILHK